MHRVILVLILINWRKLIRKDYFWLWNEFLSASGEVLEVVIWKTISIDLYLRLLIYSLRTEQLLIIVVLYSRLT